MPPPSDKRQLLDLIQSITSLPMAVKDHHSLAGADLSLFRWLHRTGSLFQHPRIALYTSHHPHADARDRAEADGYLETCLSGHSELCQTADDIDADLRLYELGDSDADRIRPMAYGMMAVEPGVDCIVLGGFGGGSDAAALSLLTQPGQWEDPLESCNGAATAAIAGSILAARLAGIPAILDNASALAALAVLCAINPALADHCATGWPLPQNAKQWFRENTALQLLPARATTLPGLNGADILRQAARLIPQTLSA
jgi:hypothetical protein